MIFQGRVIHSFCKYLLSPYYELDSILQAEDTSVHKKEFPALVVAVSSLYLEAMHLVSCRNFLSLLLSLVPQMVTKNNEFLISTS